MGAPGNKAVTVATVDVVGTGLAITPAMRVKALIGGLLMIGVMPASANEGLRLRVSPEMTMEPAWIRVQTTIEPDAQNRALRIIIDSEAYLRSSQVELDGDKPPRTSVFQYRDLPAGDYEVRGVLIGRDGHQRAIAQRSVIVLP